MPATLIPQPGAVAQVHVLLVEDRAPLDVTEPNYDRVRLTGVDLEAERLGRVGEVEAYVSKWGPLEVDGRPVALGAMSQNDLVALVRARGRCRGV